MEMLVTLFLFVSVLVAAQSEFLGNKKFPIVTDFGHKDCDNKQKLYYNPKKYRDALPGCDTFDFMGCINQKCPLGYKCAKNACELDEESCMKYYTEFRANNPYLKAMWKPECLPDGSWKAKQCKRDRCYCFDDKGKRIFGDAFLDDADDMSCACSRRRAELEQTSGQFFVSLHCDSKGNFEPLQCDSGQCWCSKPTGELTSFVVPETLMTHLPCHNSTSIGEKYLRQCESELYAQEHIKDEFAAHGQKINFQLLKCLYDGGYGPFKIVGNLNYCVWRDNNQIASYFVEGTAARKTMQCNCARDKKIYELLGRIHLMMCLANGGYDPVQHFEDEYYCVDSDGNRKSPIFLEEITQDTCDDYK